MNEHTNSTVQLFSSKQTPNSLQRTYRAFNKRERGTNKYADVGK